jgi:hypothetical protein
MSRKQSVQGVVEGIDINAAVEAAFKAAEAPGQGFDVQTLKINSINVEFGGFVPAYKTIILATVTDGPTSFSTQNDKPVPRFESLDEGPVIQGGLSIEMIIDLESQGWEKRTLKGDREDIPVTFKSDKTPSGYIIKYGTVPSGTKVMENDLLGQTLIVSCGNQCPILNRDYVVGH